MTTKTDTYESNTYKLVLGLEIHLHLNTKTKMFCSCDSNIYGSLPNTHTCPVCLGLPGALPVANFEAIKKTQLLGVGLNCKLNTHSVFDRKHYFYPDLPKGYQISQYKQPLCKEGFLQLPSGAIVELERIHLEEDTAKSFHQGTKTLLDFNKSGMPLVEIVTKPAIKSIEIAVEFCKQIQEVVRALQIADADMEKGQMRLEANISLRTSQMEQQDKLPDYKVEIKNINSFRFMEKAVLAEVQRQQELLNKGEIIKQENRGFDESTGTTKSQRDKEDAHDYRYFSEPDIPPVVFEHNYLAELKKALPLLPHQKSQKYLALGLSQHEANFLASHVNAEIAATFDDVSSHVTDIDKLAKILINKPETRKYSLAQLIELIEKPKGLIQDEAQLKIVAEKVISQNPSVVADYKKGKVTSIEFLVGKVMQETKGKADVSIARELLRNLL